MKISICVPIYKVEKYIERCAKSLFEQTYKDIEYVFVDDCTPDHSMDILNRMIPCYPNRMEQIRIVKHSHNRGLAAARNTAIENCTGEFLLHVDSDDYLAMYAVEKLVKRQLETKADIVFGQAIRLIESMMVMMERPQFKNRDVFIEDMIRPSFHHTVWGRLIRTSLYKINNIRAKERVNIGEDMQVMVQLAYYAKKVESIWDVVYYYDCTNDSSYMNQFGMNNLYRLRQDTASMEVVRDFFVGKNDYFQDLAEQYLYDYYWTHLDILGKDVSKVEFSDLKFKISNLKIENCKNTIKRKLKLIHYYTFLIAKSLAKVKV